MEQRGVDRSRFRCGRRRLAATFCRRRPGLCEDSVRARRVLAAPGFMPLAPQDKQAAEERGVRHRMENFYLPLFREFVGQSGLSADRVRVLDCGCGTGLSLDCLASAGWQAYGIDTWAARVEQWRERSAVAGARPRSARPSSVRPLCSDATRLPFRDRQFDIVFSCGLLEHIGVHEEWEPRYQVAPRAGQFEQRVEFVSECLRVLRRPGALYFDHPNGAFPVDFWHDDAKSGRVHWPGEKFLPTYEEVCSLVSAAGCEERVEALSPAGRFTFRQVGAKWWGRLLGSPCEAYFRLMRHRPFRRLVDRRSIPILCCAWLQRNEAARRVPANRPVTVSTYVVKSLPKPARILWRGIRAPPGRVGSSLSETWKPLLPPGSLFGSGSSCSRSGSRDAAISSRRPPTHPPETSGWTGNRWRASRHSAFPGPFCGSARRGSR